MKVPIHSDHSRLPQYESEGSAGMDVRAYIMNGVDGLAVSHNVETGDMLNKIVIHPGGRALIPTNLFVAVPKGYEIQIRPRSGLAIKHGITIVNSPGTIDSDYRGEIGVTLINHGHEPFIVCNRDRVCQMVLNKVERAEWVYVMYKDNLGETERGDGGFGSTGKK